MRSDDEILRELEKATEGLLFMSESDYPFELFRLEDAEALTPEVLRRKAGLDADAPVSEQSVEELFRVVAGEQEWKGEQELAVAKRYQALIALLKGELSGVSVYRVGEIQVYIYIVGRSPRGSMVGLSTRAVET